MAAAWVQAHWPVRDGIIPLVVTAQDSTSLNDDLHAVAAGRGPISTRRDGAQGLKLCDSLALTREYIPLGLVDIKVWARTAHDSPTAKADKARPIEETESHRWFG